MVNTSQQFSSVIQSCRNLFTKKLSDYGPSFRVLRTPSLTDQIYIKVKSLRNFQTSALSNGGDTQVENFIAIVYYFVIGLLQLDNGVADSLVEAADDIIPLYHRFADSALAVMEKKNH